MSTDTDTTTDTTPRPGGWSPTTIPAREGATQRYRVELLKFVGGRIDCLNRRNYENEAEALAAWASLARPSRIRARLVAAITQEWIEPAREGSSGVQFATHRLYVDAHARRDVA